MLVKGPLVSSDYRQPGTDHVRLTDLCFPQGRISITRNYRKCEYCFHLHCFNNLLSYQGFISYTLPCIVCTALLWISPYQRVRQECMLGPVVWRWPGRWAGTGGRIDHPWRGLRWEVGPGPLHDKKLRQDRPPCLVLMTPLPSSRSLKCRGVRL